VTTNVSRISDMDPRLPSLVALNGRITLPLSSFILAGRLREVMLATHGPSAASRVRVSSIRRLCSETSPPLRPVPLIASAPERALDHVECHASRPRQAFNADRAQRLRASGSPADEGDRYLPTPDNGHPVTITAAERRPPRQPSRTGHAPPTRIHSGMRHRSSGRQGDPSSPLRG
jgi:hypothetical protein